MHPKAPIAFARLAYVVLWYNRRRTDTLLKELETLLAERELSLTPELIKRIHFYTTQSAVTNHWFGQLRGRESSEQEELDGLLLGAVTPVIDDLMDSSDRMFDELEADNRQDTAEQVLYHHLMDKLRPLRAINPYFDKYARLAHLAQNASLVQMRPERLGTEQLEQITYDKGGYSTLLYRMVLRNPPIKGEEDAIYTLGALLQLMNDLFDLCKDHQSGAQTLFTLTGNVLDMEARYDTLESRFKEQFLSLDKPMRQKMRAYVSIMAIVNRARVGFSQFKTLAGKSGIIESKAHARKELVIDMENLSNIWKNVNWRVNG